MFLLLLLVLYGCSGYAMEGEISLITADNFSLTIQEHYEHAMGYNYAIGWKERPELHFSIDSENYCIDNGYIDCLQKAMVAVGKEIHQTDTAHIIMQIKDTSHSNACLYKMIINNDNHKKLNQLLSDYQKNKTAYTAPFTAMTLQEVSITHSSQPRFMIPIQCMQNSEGGTEAHILNDTIFGIQNNKTVVPFDALLLKLKEKTYFVIGADLTALQQCVQLVYDINKDEIEVETISFNLKNSTDVLYPYSIAINQKILAYIKACLQKYATKNRSYPPQENKNIEFPGLQQAHLCDFWISTQSSGKYTIPLTVIANQYGASFTSLHRQEQDPQISASIKQKFFLYKNPESNAYQLYMIPTILIGDVEDHNTYIDNLATLFEQLKRWHTNDTASFMLISPTAKVIHKCHIHVDDSMLKVCTLLSDRASLFPPEPVCEKLAPLFYNIGWMQKVEKKVTKEERLDLLYNPSAKTTITSKIVNDPLEFPIEQIEVPLSSAQPSYKEFFMRCGIGATITALLCILLYKLNYNPQIGFS
jgi:hypothetical protein